MGVHPPFLSELLRLPVRDVLHGVRGTGLEGPGRGPRSHEAVSDVPLRRWLEVPDRSVEGRGGGHDYERAAPADPAEDESRDGRNGSAAREKVRTIPNFHDRVGITN